MWKEDFTFAIHPYEDYRMSTEEDWTMLEPKKNNILFY